MGRVETWNTPEGATPLNLDEANGLIPTHISNQAELANIISAKQYYFTHKPQTEHILSADFLKQLHQKMFGLTWSWAGCYRKSNKNIGVDWPTISVELELLLDNTLYQLTHQTYGAHALAIRFHHKLVQIQLFANGNGRHARLAADLLLESQGEKSLSWGANHITLNKAETRQQYIQALRSADRGDFSPLLDFLS